VSRFSIVLLPEAEAEVREAFLWYLERSTVAASEFRTEALEAIDGLAKSAHTWPIDEDGVRHLVLRRFPFTVVYELDSDRVTVLAVAHHRRRPGYWRHP